ncbi:MAG: heparinase II/III family protein [Armatimonadetes bacterium]|nr:heparinase II/III family protein [Armatimonadota bacterium]
MRTMLCLCLALVTAGAYAAPATQVIADFETGPAWPGASLTPAPVHGGKQALLWENLPQNGSLRFDNVPTDWTPWDRLTFWLYSEKANGQRLTLVANSENPANGKDWDYYFHHFTVDWTGWRQMTLRRGVELKVSRRPLGWDRIQSLTLNSGGWDHSALPDTRLVLDDVKLTRDILGVATTGKTVSADGQQVTQRVRITSRADAPLTCTVKVAPPEPRLFAVGVDKPTVGPLAPEQSAEVQVALRLKPGVKAEPLTIETVCLEVAPVQPDREPMSVELSAAVPLPPRPHPHLALTAEGIQRAKDRAAKYDWAKGTLAGIIAAGDRALNLSVADIPDHGGQWWHYYVCKACGFGLKRVDATHHECPKCKQVYSGWPWDDVVISSIHSGFTRAVRELGLAYAFTGDLKYAAKAREILLVYGEKYPTFPLHDVGGGQGRSGGRLYAQTLDESVDVIGSAWGYDLLYDAPCFTAEDRAQIENGYFREVCRTIQRHDAGISNWQSWHNAGVAAVGFCLDDPELMGWAINGKSGLRFQLAHSVLPDGWWFEGAVGYHWYALDALRYTVQAAAGAGMDFYADAAYRSLHEAPVLYTFPNGTFPSINDSSGGSIGGSHRLYEIAYSHWQEPAFAWVASFGNRKSLEAFLWGADELPQVTAPKLASKDFAGLGAAVLRAGSGDGAAYVHLDYGPHGGGHGHPDKLVVTLFALGQELAPDPGALAYAAALHGSWYRQTLAHNTVVIDQKSQAPTEGRLELFANWGEAALASATCDTAYPGVKLARTSLLTSTYLLDLYTVAGDQPHTIDFVWHNVGEMTPGLPTTPRAEPLGKDNGYQHFTGLQTASGAQDWSVEFKTDKGKVRLLQAGAAGTELLFGMGMTGRPPRPCPMVVARRQGKEAVFASAVSWSPTEPDVSAVKLLPVTVAGEGTAYGLSVQRGDIEDVLIIGSVGVEKTCAGLKTTARAMFVSRQGGKVLAVKQIE